MGKPPELPTDNEFLNVVIGVLSERGLIHKYTIWDTVGAIANKIFLALVAIFILYLFAPFILEFVRNIIAFVLSIKFIKTPQEKELEKINKEFTTLTLKTKSMDTKRHEELRALAKPLIKPSPPQPKIVIFLDNLIDRLRRGGI